MEIWMNLQHHQSMLPLGFMPVVAHFPIDRGKKAGWCNLLWLPRFFPPKQILFYSKLPCWCFFQVYCVSLIVLLFSVTAFSMLQCQLSDWFINCNIKIRYLWHLYIYVCALSSFQIRLYFKMKILGTKRGLRASPEQMYNFQSQTKTCNHV